MSKKIQIISDRKFENGFMLNGFMPVDEGRAFEVIKVLDYDGKAKGKSMWYLPQWFVKNSLKDAPLQEISQGCFCYSNDSATVIADTIKGQLTLRADSTYDYSPVRKDGPWVHLLIEQNFSQPLVSVFNTQKIVASMDFTVEEIIDKTPEGMYDSNNHAAQLVWFVQIQNRPDLFGYPNTDSLLGSNSDFLWFGIPLYDNRLTKVGESVFFDAGTTRFVYGMDSTLYLPDEDKLGKPYKISIDVLPYIKKAISKGKEAGGLKNVREENLVIGNMNFGWELPGNFDAKVVLRDISIEAELL